MFLIKDKHSCQFCGHDLTTEEKESSAKRLSEEFVMLPVSDYGPKEHVTKILGLYAMEENRKKRENKTV